MRKIEYDSNFSEFNRLIKNKKDASDKYFFVTNNGRWIGFVDENILKTVSLKKRGKEFVGLSPFKNEKTPSFTVNDEKEFYHCFATSEHGNIFDFVIKKTKNAKDNLEHQFPPN